MNKFHFSYIFTIVSLVSLISCASPQAPSGGLPDKTPPIIAETFPTERSTQFRDKEVSLSFSKFMNRQSVRENLTIFPATPYTLSWTGKTMSVEFSQPLDSNTTYTISLGTDYTDWRGNKPEQSFSLSFSTGEKLDSCSISGRIVEPIGEKSIEGSYVFLYQTSAEMSDTLNPMHTKPKAKLQIGSNGKFAFRALSPSTYRVIVVKDEFRDDVFTPGTDAFSTSPSGDITFSRNGDSANINFLLTNFSARPQPKIFDVRPLSAQRILSTFSQAMNTATFISEYFSIADSVSGASLRIRSVFPADERTAEIVLWDTLQESTVYRFTCSKNIKDSLQFPLSDSAKAVYFRGVKNSDIDTVFRAKFRSVSLRTDDKNASFKPILLSASTKDTTRNIPLNGHFVIAFEHGIDTASLRNSLAILTTDKLMSIPANMSWNSPSEAIVQSISPLQSFQKYSFFLQFSPAKSLNSNDITDSARTLHIQTIDNSLLSDVSGSVTRDSNYINSGHSLRISLIASDKSRTYSSNVSTNGSWKIQNVIPGDYFVFLFEDSDNNEQYSFGSVFPFRAAEKFALSDKPLTVRARWALENIRLTFPMR